jgi:hypothetical protein
MADASDRLVYIHPTSNQSPEQIAREVDRAFRRRQISRTGTPDWIPS